jgi:erythronate-4-phosphate dehydrogenase
MLKIVADHKIPFLKGALDEKVRMVYVPGADISRSHLKDADGMIVRTRTSCNQELLGGTSVRFIATATIGYDHIDTDYCRENGIGWANAPGCNASSVEQYMVSALLWLAMHRNLDLRSMTLGVVGVGHVGSKVAKAARALGMKVLLNDPPRKRREGGDQFSSLKELREGSDLVTVHVPLVYGGSDSTHHLVDEEFLDGLKSGALLFNTSRGGVVDEEALKRAIRKGGLSGVVLDVFENEPAIDRDLLGSITLATPHIAGYSLDGKANGTAMSVQAVSRYFGLGMDRWTPATVPLPQTREILVDATEGELPELLWQAFQHTYDVSADDRRLRNAPETFESLRGNYPFRREPAAYSVRIFQGYPELREIYELLGFSVLSDQCM